MGKAKSNPMDMLQLDIQYRDRQLAAELAMHNAEIAYQTKYMELVDLPGLEEDKRQFSLQYALEQAKFDFESEMAKMEFGESQRQFDIQADIDRRRLQLEQNAQEFDQMIRTGQMALDESSVTGFYKGNPTMQRVQMEAGLTGYYNGQATMDREKFMESIRQFDQQNALDKAQTFLNAPRGPADYPAYLNRLAGLQNQGFALPGVVNQLLTGQQIGTVGANQGALPMSGTQFANALVYGNGQPVPPSTPPTQTNPMFSSAAGGTAGGIPPASAQPGGGNMISGGQDVNYRDWERMSPVAQQYTAGYVEENLGQPKEDFLWGIAQGAPTLNSAPTAKTGTF